MDRILGSSIERAEPPSTSSASFCPASHAPESFKRNDGLRVRRGEDPRLALLRAVAREQSQICVELLSSSLPPKSIATRDIIPRRNGFVHTVIEAYNNHRALIVRPDDVWLAIMTQFCFFVNGNAEALRSVFVAHEGKKKLVITSGGNRYSMDPANMACQMTELMESHIIDESLREWIVPSFTTTTATDRATSAFVMMGTMKEYFSYGFCLRCGIPKVTLEGEKGDWEEILRRLERLKKYGVQTITWYHLLRPIVSCFVGAYDNPTSTENLDFWNKVAHFSGGGSGPTWLSGWITAFCVFDEQGQWKGNTFNENTEDVRDPLHLNASQFASAYLLPEARPYLTLDGFPYFSIDSSKVPCGYTHVDVKLDDNGEFFDTMFVSGLIGSHISSTTKTEIFPEGTRDTVQPIPGWWYFIKGDEAKQSQGPDSEGFEEANSESEHRNDNTLVYPFPPEKTSTKRNGRSLRQDVISRAKSLFDIRRRKYL